MADTDAWLSGTYPRPKEGWTCYHCGETFYIPALAAEHFGASPLAKPGCFLKVQRGEERGLLFAIRELEEQLARYADEDTDLHRQIAKLGSEQGEALRREEEAGYARGLRDERARVLRIIVRIKAGLRSGGARNVCDVIRSDIEDCRDG